MRTITFLFLLLLASSTIVAQKENLPLRTWKGNKNGKYIFYITGDGGFERFTKRFCSDLSKSGYTVTALNARAYFWEKKTKEQATCDVSKAILEDMKKGNFKNFILLGYSFGADVLPFIANKFPEELSKKLTDVVLLSPSRYMDFQIHFTDMIFDNIRRSNDVVQEINRIQAPNTVLIFGSKEKEFPVDKITLKNYKLQIIPGKHHYDGDAKALASAIISNLR